MKQVLLPLAFMLFTTSLFAQLEQEQPSPNHPFDFRSLKHSVSFGMVGGGEMADGFLPLPGLGYKYFTENGAFRVMVGGIMNASTTSGQWGGTMREAGSNIRIGYQYHVMLKRFMPMIGVDLAGGYYESINENWGRYEMESTTVGISPNLGLGFWISPKISFFIDTRFDIGYRDHLLKDEWFNDWTGQWEGTTTRTQGIQTSISPVSSFMAAFHF